MNAHYSLHRDAITLIGNPANRTYEDRHDAMVRLLSALKDSPVALDLARDLGIDLLQRCTMDDGTHPAAAPGYDMCAPCQVAMTRFRSTDA